MLSWVSPFNLTWVDLAFSGTKGYPGQVKRHSLPFQEEAVLKCLVVPLTFALDCKYKLNLNSWEVEYLMF